MGWVKLCVREEDAEKALAALDRGPVQPEPEARCPKCGSADVHHEKYNLRWVYAFILVFKIPRPIKKDRWVCWHWLMSRSVELPRSSVPEEHSNN